MAYPAKAVANEFLKLAEAGGNPISPMKLLKLVYFAHGWYLAITDQPLIEERVEAWQYGPVIPVLYHEFKRFGNDSITERATDAPRYVGGKSISDIPYINASACDPSASEVKTLIEKVWKTYGSQTAGQLSSATHQAGTPWAQTYTGQRSLVIPDEVIKEYYKKRITASA